MIRSVAREITPLVTALIGHSDRLPIRFWDGSTLGPSGANTIVVKSPQALRRLLWAPGELGLGRAYVAGDIDLEGDIMEIISLAHESADDDSEVIRRRIKARDLPGLIRIAGKLGALGRPPTPPPE